MKMATKTLILVFLKVSLWGTIENQLIVAQIIATAILHDKYDLDFDIIMRPGQGHDALSNTLFYFKI